MGAGAAPNLRRARTRLRDGKRGARPIVIAHSEGAYLRGASFSHGTRDLAPGYGDQLEFDVERSKVLSESLKGHIPVPVEGVLHSGPTHAKSAGECGLRNPACLQSTFEQRQSAKPQPARSDEHSAVDDVCLLSFSSSHDPCQFFLWPLQVPSAFEEAFQTTFC